MIYCPEIIQALEQKCRTKVFWCCLRKLLLRNIGRITAETEDSHNKPIKNRTGGLPMSYAFALSKQNTGITQPIDQMMQNTGFSQHSNQMMQNTGISQPSNQMVQNHVMQNFINEVKFMNNSMQALTNLFSRNAMMNPLEQGFFT